MPPTYKEFPSVPIPPWLQGDGWEDESWHNDAMPRSCRVLGNARVLSVWVDFDAPEMREWEDGGKYTVTHEDALRTDDLVEVYSGDSEDEAQAAIARVIEENK